MYLSRITFHTQPGKTQQVEERLMTLLHWVERAGGSRPRVLRTHYGSPGARDLVFEQEVPDPSALETQIKKVTENGEFQQWAKQVSELWSTPRNASCTRYATHDPQCRKGYGSLLRSNRNRSIGIENSETRR